MKDDGVRNNKTYIYIYLVSFINIMQMFSGSFPGARCVDVVSCVKAEVGGKLHLVMAPPLCDRGITIVAELEYTEKGLPEMIDLGLTELPRNSDNPTTANVIHRSPTKCNTSLL